MNNFSFKELAKQFAANDTYLCKSYTDEHIMNIGSRSAKIFGKNIHYAKIVEMISNSAQYCFSSRGSMNIVDWLEELLESVSDLYTASVLLRAVYGISDKDLSVDKREEKLRDIINYSEKCTYKLRVNQFLMRSIHGITKLMQYGDNDTTAMDAYLFLYSAYDQIKNHINISERDIMLIHTTKLNQFEINLAEAEACENKENIKWRI